MVSFTLNAARLHVVVDGERIDLVVGGLRRYRGKHSPSQRGQHHQEERDYGPSEPARKLPGALASGRGNCTISSLSPIAGGHGPVGLPLRLAGCNGLALVVLTLAGSEGNLDFGVPSEK